MRTMREAAREIAAREAEEEGLSERSVPALVQEKREARRFMQMELKLPRDVPRVIDEGSDAEREGVRKMALTVSHRPYHNGPTLAASVGEWAFASHGWRVAKA